MRIKVVLDDSARRGRARRQHVLVSPSNCGRRLPRRGRSWPQLDSASACCVGDTPQTCRIVTPTRPPPPPTPRVPSPPRSAAIHVRGRRARERMKKCRYSGGTSTEPAVLLLRERATGRVVGDFYLCARRHGLMSHFRPLCKSLIPCELARFVTYTWQPSIVATKIRRPQ